MCTHSPKSGTDGDAYTKRKRPARATTVRGRVPKVAAARAPATPKANGTDGDVSAKRKRPDRVEKIQKRKGQRLTVVKSALWKYLRGDNARDAVDADEADASAGASEMAAAATGAACVAAHSLQRQR
jgi:hypothetical protein